MMDAIIHSIVEVGVVIESVVHSVDLVVIFSIPEVVVVGLQLSLKQ